MQTSTYQQLKLQCSHHNATLIAVSKTKPAASITELYDIGHRDFGENYVQEMVEKQNLLPNDIQWHFLGHLQRNKVKQIAPFVHLIHSVDSLPLLEEIQKQANKNNRTINVLLQLNVTTEETKFGMDENELLYLLEVVSSRSSQFQNIQICGIMGIASNTDNKQLIRKNFQQIFTAFQHTKNVYFIGKSYYNICSMGMSSDYQIALEEGSTMLRIGSLLFGSREYAQK